MALGREDRTSRYDRRAVGVFPTRAAAETALHELKASGFNMDRVSVVTKDNDHKGGIEGATVKDKVGNKADEGAGVGAVSGGTLGGLTGLLVGLGTLAIPGVGPIMLAGATATALATTVAGGAIGAAAGGLLGGLIGLGIPEKEARHYNDRVHHGDYLVIVDGTESEIRNAETILKRQGIKDWSVNAIPAAELDRTVAVNHPMTGVAPEPVLGAVPTAPLIADEAVRAGSDDTIKLYEERLVVDKDREKTGEVAIGKHVETETARVSVPIEKERVVIERVAGTTETVVPGDVAFADGETIRVDVYEETPDIRKEAFVREEVTLRKEVAEETVSAQETLRREELDVSTEGHPVVNADRAVDDRL